jgi:hypothetical protein
MSIKAMSVMGCDGGITRRNLCRHNCCDGENCVTWLEKQFAKLNEYEEAKAEGRLVVLPCKVGDNVYFLLQELDGEWYVSSPHRITEIGTRGFWTSAFPLEKPNAMDDFTSWSEFGKTVFLTKEEAEKALEVIRGLNYEGV